MARKQYIELHIAHIGVGLRKILGFADKDEDFVVDQLTTMLQRSRK